MLPFLVSYLVITIVQYSFFRVNLIYYCTLRFLDLVSLTCIPSSLCLSFYKNVIR